MFWRERGFIQRDIYTKYFRYTAKMEGYAKYCRYTGVMRKHYGDEMVNDRVRKLAEAAQISDSDEIAWLEEQVSQPRIFTPIEISPIDEFKELVMKNPREAMEVYWKEIDQRNLYFRTSMHRMIKEHSDAFLNSFERPLTSAASLRGVIECTVKFVGINWAIVAMYNQMKREMSKGPKEVLVTSQQLENVLLSFSHFTKAEVEPLVLILKYTLTLEEALSKVTKESEHKRSVPTISKLFGIAKFLEPQMGSMLHYIYSTICDLIHSGPLALALKDADDIKKIKNIDINDVIALECMVFCLRF